MKIDPKDFKLGEGFQDYFDLAVDKTKKNKAYHFMELLQKKSAKYSRFRSFLLASIGICKKFEDNC
jgi:hypothetical protein